MTEKLRTAIAALEHENASLLTLQTEMQEYSNRHLRFSREQGEKILKLESDNAILERDHEAMNYLREQAPNNSILLMTEIATCRYFVLRMTPHPSRVINDPADAILAAKEAAK
jgi:hypothetical protein